MTSRAAQLDDALSLGSPAKSIELLLTSRKYFVHLAALLLLGDAALCALIIRFVSYTEIDWATYIQQVEVFLAGERDYSLLKGDTGPLVYPAGHLYLYAALRRVTNDGRDIKRAQCIFAAIYLATQALVFTLYRRSKTMPPWTLIPLTLSKRLHSIYMLRCFNDGLAMLFLYASMVAWTSRRPNWRAAPVLFSLALSVKMNVLLYLPAVGYLLVVYQGLAGAVSSLALIAGVQVLLAAPFIGHGSYFSNAFDLSREFLYKWTVNWRWVGEEGFSDRRFHVALLAAHLAAIGLLVFAWAEREGGVLKLARRAFAKPREPAGASVHKSGQAPLVDADHFITAMFSANLAGITFARSLHYQFYAWYAQQLVFLLMHTPYEAPACAALLAAIEWAWNVFPSSLNSSMVLTFAHWGLFAGVYYGDVAGKSIAENRAKGQ